MLGYQNKVLRVNLNHKTYSTEPLNMEWAEKYIGGKGLGIRYMYDEVTPGLDPLSPENKLILMTAPLTGTPAPCSGKLAIISKSPATGTILDCSIGGHSAIKIKYAGYDTIIFEGKLDKPGYISIVDDTIEFIDADELWGKGSHETETILAKKYGHQTTILSIGPAGENLLNISCINSDYYRQAGRGGIGAVMGSKNLKAVTIKGSGGLKINDIKNTVKRIHQILREDTVSEENYWAYTDGTVGVIEACNDGGALPFKNFSDTTDESWIKYNSEQVKANRHGKKGCGSCGLGCGNFTKIGDAICEGPEYETAAGAGPNCGISDLEAIVKFNQVCDDLGMDTISASVIISYAMEMTETGKHDFGIKFGDKEKLIEYLSLMANKEGVGADLAMGVKPMAAKYGGEDIAMHTKGLEFPMYDPRASWAMGLSYAVSDRGGCHMRSYPIAEEIYNASIPPYTAEGKGKLVFDLSCYNAVKFSLIFCDFWALGVDTMAEIMSLVTGKSFTEDDMNEIAENVIHLARAFNQREGFDRKDDTVPKRILNEALKSGVAAGQKIPKPDFNKMLDEYYECLGWTKEGIVPDSVISQL